MNDNLPEAMATTIMLLAITDILGLIPQILDVESFNREGPACDDGRVFEQWCLSVVTLPRV